MSSKSFRLWAAWRRIQYGLGFASFWGLVGVLIFFMNFYQSPTCSDGIINGTETGLDCGGECVRICATDIIQPRVVWAEGFEITEGQYNAVAYVENQNFKAGTPALSYTFELYDGDRLVGERLGSTVLPPNSTYPIFEGKIFTDDKAQVTETRIIIGSAEDWLPADLNRDQFESRGTKLSRSDTNPRLDVELVNNEIADAEDVEVVATIFNENGDPVTASQTVEEYIAGRSTADLVFTWPNPIAKTVKNCVIPTDVAVGIDLSGSMNNDGGEPPEPVTSALQAAGKFVDALKKNDQVAVVTFATDATLVTSLTSNHKEVGDIVRGLEISPEEESGFTNTPVALLTMQKELNSERHNVDARRVLVLLTDGLPTAAGESDIVSETKQKAAELDESGIELYIIGLGEGVDKDFVKALASGESNAYFAPTGEDLAKIYAEITSSLCEVGPTKIDVFAKTKTNFAPIK